MRFVTLMMNKSYKLTLNLLTKEIASTESKTPATDPGYVSKHQKHVLVLDDSIVKNVDGWRIGRSTRARTP